MIDDDLRQTPEAEAKASLLLSLRASGIQSIAVLRAMEAVPRIRFVLPRHAEFAARDIALPIGYGQTMSEPSFVARMLEALDCTETDRVLEVGSGSGYATALLARLAGEVHGFERVQSLALEAQSRLADLGVTSASIDWADGLLVPPMAYDRIVIHAALDRPPLQLLERLNTGGHILFGLNNPTQPGQGRAQWLIRMSRSPDGFSETEVCASRLQAAQASRSNWLRR